LRVPVGYEINKIVLTEKGRAPSKGISLSEGLQG
jgi:hypothetical protein